VTRKTIETHLGHVYSKLDISGRGQLVHALAELVPER
jgi:DNA-binding CsgD family transcriptional regulator